jgi:hypothetical protein
VLLASVVVAGDGEALVTFGEEVAIESGGGFCGVSSAWSPMRGSKIYLSAD